MSLLDRIEAATNGNRLKVMDYVTRDMEENVLEIRCKLCAARIQGMVPIPEAKPLLDVIEGHTRTKHIPVRLAALANYQEIVIEFDDNSAHVTQICKKCAKNLSNDDLEALYVCDAAALMVQSERASIVMPKSLWDTRKPVSYYQVRVT